MSRLMKVKKLSPNGQIPTKAHGYEDAGWDLYASENVTVYPRSGYCDIPTAIAVELPSGVFGRITNRSCTNEEFGVDVKEAIIDNGYRGELFIKVKLDLSMQEGTPRGKLIRKGDRIAQMTLHQILDIIPLEVAELSLSMRGTNGQGSTGR